MACFNDGSLFELGDLQKLNVVDLYVEAFVLS